MELDEQQLLRTVTRVVNTLKAGDIPFAVAGGCAVYALGGPASEHDVDVFVREADAIPARDVLIKEGMHPVDPPEDWLLKVYDADCLVDLIFRPNRRPVTAELLQQAIELRIGPATAPVLPATLVLIDKLRVLEAHRCDFTPLLPIARALREQVDWAEVGREAASSPYARAFLQLLADLDVIPRPGSNRSSGPGKEPAMAEHGNGDAPQYSVAHIRQALAQDPRTSELGVQVTIRGHDVYLSGIVPSAQRKAELEHVLHEHEPALAVHNDVQVVQVGEPREPEDLR